ncbi:outer membrane protein, cobalt-zinc-cadmium efflux system [Cupriavidus sp. OV038]|jgi:cobalt-zinc-cadmium efflux system outer membrane protein|nr:outer membrane protein, cobalt-zinc-cadmium efflux system [Cupriavidus sp. OV038]SFP94158.1 outer membrane protein, cobalt-zinc-cadmium efflux system [Cupriavidus sp. OV096]
MAAALAWCGLLPHAAAQLALPPVSPPAGQEPPGPLTLETALALAIAQNPTLSASRHELDATEGGITQARVIPNPEVAVLMEDTRQSTRTTTAQMNLPVELGGKRAARIGVAQRTRELAQAQLEATQADLRASVIGAFFNVLVAQERVRLAAGAVDIARRGANVAARRVAAGKVSPVEETKAGVELANAELERAEADAALVAARQALATLWGNPSPQFAEADGSLDTLPARPDALVLREALDAAPATVASQRELARRQAEINVERSRQYPDVTLSLGAKRENASDRGYYPVLGVAIPLPLFDRNQGNLYTAIRQADKAADTYRATRLRLDHDLQQATSQLAVSRGSAQTLRDTVLPAAQRAYQAATQGFEAGKFSYLEVLDAQRTLFQARIRYLGVVANAWQAATTIDRILGR